MVDKFVDINNRDEFVDALADLLTSDVCHTKHKKGCLAPTCRDCIDRFFEMCSHLLPAADVAQVAHGHWLTWEEQFPGLEPRRKNNLGAYCSSCHTRSDSISPYCSICGAKMDDEVNDT